MRKFKKYAMFEKKTPWCFTNNESKAHQKKTYPWHTHAHMKIAQQHSRNLHWVLMKQMLPTKNLTKFTH